MSEILEESLDQTEDTQKGKYLIFSLGSDSYGIEIKYVTEIIGIQAITPIPEIPEYIKGVINLRGKIIPVMDVRTRFRKEEREYDDRTCIIVVEIKDIYIGLIVDRVSEVMSILDDNIAPPPKLSKGYSNRYIKGLGKISDEVKILLDCHMLFSDEEAEDLMFIG